MSVEFKPEQDVSIKLYYGRDQFGNPHNGRGRIVKRMPDEMWNGEPCIRYQVQIYDQVHLTACTQIYHESWLEPIEGEFVPRRV
jgi:hypothetical protein